MLRNGIFVHCFSFFHISPKIRVYLIYLSSSTDSESMQCLCLFMINNSENFRFRSLTIPIISMLFFLIRSEFFRIISYSRLDYFCLISGSFLYNIHTFSHYKSFYIRSSLFLYQIGIFPDLFCMIFTYFLIIISFIYCQICLSDQNFSGSFHTLAEIISAYFLHLFCIIFTYFLIFSSFI